MTVLYLRIHTKKLPSYEQLAMYNAYAPDDKQVKQVELKLDTAKEQQKRLFVQVMQLVVSLIMYQTGNCKKYQDAGDKINEANWFGI